MIIIQYYFRMLKISIVIILGLSCFNVFANGALNLGESSNSSANNDDEPDGCSGPFADIYAKFMHQTPEANSIEASDLLNEALNLYETRMSNLDKQRCHEQMLELGDLHYLLTNKDCIDDSLDYRSTRAAKFSIDSYQPGLVKFVNFNNNKQFNECKNQLEVQIQEAMRRLESHARQSGLKSLLEFIHVSNPGELNESTFREDVANGFNRYLESTGYNMQIDTKSPLDRNLDGLKNYLDETINSDCNPILNELAQLLFDGQIISTLANKLNIDLNWAESTKQVMQLASICNIIKNLGAELYLVRNYNVIEPSRILYDDDSDAALGIDQITRIVADMRLYYQARQAVYDEDNRTELNDLDSLDALQSLGPNNCQTTTLAIINQLYERNREYTHLKHYIEHEGHRLLTMCMPLFERELHNRVQTYPRSFSARISQIYSNMKDLITSTGTPFTNRTVIPRDVFRRAFSQFLRDNRIPVVAGRYIESRNLRRVESDASSLIIIPCTELLTSLGDQFIAFMDQLSKLDRIDPSPFTQDSEEWIANINICRAIAGF